MLHLTLHLIPYRVSDSHTQFQKHVHMQTLLQLGELIHDYLQVQQPDTLSLQLMFPTCSDLLYFPKLLLNNQIHLLPRHSADSFFLSRLPTISILSWKPLFWISSDCISNSSFYNIYLLNQSSFLNHNLVKDAAANPSADRVSIVNKCNTEYKLPYSTIIVPHSTCSCFPFPVTTQL